VFFTRPHAPRISINFFFYLLHRRVVKAVPGAPTVRRGVSPHGASAEGKRRGRKKVTTAAGARGTGRAMEMRRRR